LLTRLSSSVRRRPLFSFTISRDSVLPSIFSIESLHTKESFELKSFKLYDKPSVVLIHHFQGLCFTLHLFHPVPSQKNKKSSKRKSFKLYDKPSVVLIHHFQRLCTVTKSDRFLEGHSKFPSQSQKTFVSDTGKNFTLSKAFFLRLLSGTFFHSGECAFFHL
jgi:hypothetical protein